MAIERLDHINLRTTQLEVMVDWYTSVLDMRAGERPDFAFPGAWLYLGKSPVVHLIGIDGDPGVGSESPLKLEHFAFAATGLKKFEAKIQVMGLTCRRSDKPEFNLIQVNLWDPDGNHLHVDFPADE